MSGSNTIQLFLNTGSAAPFGSVPITLGTGTTVVGQTIAASGSLVSSVFPTQGLANAGLGVGMSHAGTLALDRYIDNAGSIAIGASSTIAVTAGTIAILEVNDGKAWGFGKVSLINSAGAAATITAFAGVLQKV